MKALILILAVLMASCVTVNYYCWDGKEYSECPKS
jgi:hypothetical protein